MEQKTFYRILLELSRTPQKSKQYLSDQRLSLAEKKIIEGHLLIRNNQNDKVIDLLKPIVGVFPSFVEAQKNLLLGVAFNNLSRFDEAGEHLRLAALILDETPFHHFRFNAWFNLFLTYFNQGKQLKMKSALGVLKEIPQLNETSKIRLLRCQFLFHFEIDEFEKAREYLYLIRNFKNKMVESDLISHLVAEFMFYVKVEEFKNCENVLQEMKKHRKFQLTENFNFMKVLLDHLCEDTPIYAYDDTFKNTPVLFHQLKLLQSFESGDAKASLFHWEQLQDLMSEHFAEPYSYVGPKNLFSLCLNKHLLMNSNEKKMLQVVGSTKKEILLSILIHQKSPITKETLFEMVWGRSAQCKDDLQMLTRLISRVRKENHVQVQTRKGAYFVKAAG